MNLKKRFPYWYFEHCSVFRKDSQLVIKSETDEFEIPLNDIGFLMLGSGVSISSNLISHVNRTGGHIVIASSTQVPTAIMTTKNSYGSAKMAYKQALKYSSKLDKLKVATKLFLIKYPNNEDIKKITRIRDIFGIEGPLMRKLYEEVFGKTFIRIKRHDGDLMNHKINVLYNALYNICFVACHEYGFSPHLGFIHGVKRYSFIYDIADLFKTKEFLEIARDARDVPHMLELLSFKCHEVKIFSQLEEVFFNVFDIDGNEMEEEGFYRFKDYTYNLFGEEAGAGDDTAVED